MEHEQKKKKKKKWNTLSYETKQKWATSHKFASRFVRCTIQTMKSYHFPIAPFDWNKKNEKQKKTIVLSNSELGEKGKQCGTNQ